MSGEAWLMMLGTWGVVIGVSGYLLWKVVSRPRSAGTEGRDPPTTE